MAPATWGTTVLPTGKPTPRSSRYCMTPQIASSPKALPPARTTASTCGHEVARIEELEAVHAGRPAADLDAADRGPSGRITVQPVSADGIGGVADADAGDHARAPGRAARGSRRRGARGRA